MSYVSKRNLNLFRLGTPDLLQSPEMARPGNPARNADRNSPRPESLDSQSFPVKYSENTEKIPPKYQKCHSGYFFGILGVLSWGSGISARGVFFRYFSWKYQVGPSRGSVTGQGVLNVSN